MTMPGSIKEKDGSFVQMIKELGGVPFCLTNIPQTMLSYGSSNPIYGATTNPYDTKRSPGGSSSGEAALLAQGGSILGVGSDVGGSLRMPAHFCGITSLKPTTNRLIERGRIVGVCIKLRGPYEKILTLLPQSRRLMSRSRSCDESVLE